MPELPHVLKSFSLPSRAEIHLLHNRSRLSTFVDLPINVFGLELSKEDMVRLDNFQQTVFVNFSKTVRQSSGSALLEGRLPHSQERACADSIRAESICANLGRMKPEHWP